MAAANLTQAAAQASENVQTAFQGAPNLKTQLVAWIAAIKAAIPDVDSVAKRTVLNWIPRGNELAADTPAVKGDQTQAHANDIAVYVWQTCAAARAAQASARITAGEAAALLASYNTIWP